MGSFVRFYTFGGFVGMPSNLRVVARRIGLRDATYFISISTFKGVKIENNAKWNFKELGETPKNAKTLEKNN